MSDIKCVIVGKMDHIKKIVTFGKITHTLKNASQLKSHTL